MVVRRIILVEPGSNKIYIDCTNVPPPGGAVEDKVIPGAQRVNGLHYEYLQIPPGTPGPVQPNDIVINLTNPITPPAPPSPGNIEMPFNGGRVHTFSVKIL